MSDELEKKVQRPLVKKEMIDRWVPFLGSNNKQQTGIEALDLDGKHETNSSIRVSESFREI